MPVVILDVVVRHTDLDEAADQVAYVRIAAVAGAGVGDDKRAEVVKSVSPHAVARLRQA